MTYVSAVLLGAVWGVGVGLVNMLLLRAALKKNQDKAFLGANMLRTLLDLLAFVVVFLLREILPLPYTFVLVGTAVGLSLTTIVTSYRLAGKK